MTAYLSLWSRDAAYHYPLCAIAEIKKTILSIFKNIEYKLKSISDELGATMTIDRPWAPKSLHQFEERRIDWEENNLNKTIIIQPLFGKAGVDVTKWSMINVAWIKRKGIAQKPGWICHLVDNVEFQTIENQIDELLRISKANLQSIEFKAVEELSCKSI